MNTGSKSGELNGRINTMGTTPENKQFVSGLRERKKIKTRAAIKEQALRLFAEQGYEATTVEQIAEAAEVSPSTFFRYFPAKEDIVLCNMPSSTIVEMFKLQPPGLSPIQALRAAVHELHSKMPPEELAMIRKRVAVIHAVPELRARFYKEFVGLRERLNELVGERVGRKANDFEVIVFTGAIIGVWIAVAHMPGNSLGYEEFPVLFDRALAQLEDGLPFN
jgi:AcrR family transcriptional regulator